MNEEPQYVFVASLYNGNPGKIIGIYSSANEMKEQLTKIQAELGFYMKWEHHLERQMIFGSHYDGVVVYSVTQYELDKTL